jgi:putative transposase
VSVRAAIGRKLVAEGAAPKATIAKVLSVSRQTLYLKPKTPRTEDGKVVQLRLVAPALPENWLEMELQPDLAEIELAIHVMARRHPAAGYRKITARLRRKRYVVNRKRVARLLRRWGLMRATGKRHPKAQGRPFDIGASNELWQTDMTSIWCGEDGWGYFCAVIDCFDRSIIGWTFTLRCRAKDVSPAMEMAWASAFPHGPDGTKVTLRHDNGTQFTSIYYREVADDLDITLSRTAYRHPDGNAFIERVFRTLKEEAVWPNEFTCFEEALAALEAWLFDYNFERPHDSLGDRTPAEARAEALANHKTAA